MMLALATLPVLSLLPCPTSEAVKTLRSMLWMKSQRKGGQGLELGTLETSQCSSVDCDE